MTDSSKRILFSPLGMNDPVNKHYYTEGSLLQIVRKYEPDVIYLYMTKEICERYEEDNRYQLALDKVYKGEQGIDKDYEIVLKVEPEMDSPHEYDQFIKIFRNYIEEIVESFPANEILLNVSSGTPAMKASLLFLKSFLHYNLTPVQVSSPDNKSNIGRGLSLDIERMLTSIENNNGKGLENRTLEVETDNFDEEIIKNVLKNHILCYDYSAASNLAGENKQMLPKESYHMINVAYHRFMLDEESVREELDLINNRLTKIHEDKDVVEAIEYDLYLDILTKRGNILEFTRGLTPLIYKIGLLVVKYNLGINLLDYLQDDEDAPKLSKKKLLDNELGRKIVRTLEEKFPEENHGVQFNWNHFLNSGILAIIIRNLLDTTDDNNKIKRNYSSFTDVEYKIRNAAAHEIIHIDEEVFFNYTGLKVRDVLKRLREIIERLDTKIDLLDEYAKDRAYHGRNRIKFDRLNPIWDSYEIMNQKIIESL